MLTSIRGYVEVYDSELHARCAAETPADAEAVAQTFRATTTDTYPAAQLATYLSHHADLVQQLSGVVPHRVISQSIAPVAGKTAELPVVVSARLLSSNLSRTFNAALHALTELHDYAIPPATRAADGGAAAGAAAAPPQAALLALSQLHAEYGHMGHAMAALMEAVDVDQGGGDGEWLVTCLMQLCALMRTVLPEQSALAKSPTAVMQVRGGLIAAQGCARAAAAVCVTRLSISSLPPARAEAAARVAEPTKSLGASEIVCACVQGVAPTHFHLLEQLLNRCIAQALEHRLPAFFANATLALAELCTTHQVQPAAAATDAAVHMTTRKGCGRLFYSTTERSEGGGDAAAPLAVERKALTGVSPAAVVRAPFAMPGVCRCRTVL